MGMEMEMENEMNEEMDPEIKTETHIENDSETTNAESEDDDSENERMDIIMWLANYIKRYVFIKEESFYFLAALWIIGTYLHMECDFFGYLFIYSPEKHSGKTRFLEVLNQLVYNSSGITCSTTASVLFRDAINKTHLFDEVDRWPDKSDLIGIINAGFQKNGMVKRSVMSGRNYKAAEFPVYAPRVFAGIGKSILDDTTKDRTFIIRMVKQLKVEKRLSFRDRKIRHEIRVLRAAIEIWVEINRDKVRNLYLEANFPYLEELADRTIEVSEPLAAIVETEYEGRPELPSARILLCKAIALARDEEQKQPNRDHIVLRVLASIAQKETPLTGMASELGPRCRILDESITEQEITNVLQKYEFPQKSKRLGKCDPRTRYVIEYEQIADLVARYAGSGGETKGGTNDDQATTSK